MGRPTESQPVLTELTSSAIFLILTVDHGGEAVVRDLLPDVAGLSRSVGFRYPEAGLACVLGIGSNFWDRLFGSPRPSGLHPFREVVGAVHRAPATPGDLVFHIRATRLDMCFELASLLTDRLRTVAQVVDEVHGFKYFDERDLLGFVDGTENPTGYAAAEAAIIGAEDPQFAGGSYVIVQKYLHDLDAWNTLSTEQQERVIGRTKLADIELADDVKPSNSHVALNTIEDADGTERQIVRDNMPFGHIGTREFGTYYIAYSRTPDVTELMLERMFIGDPPGNHDRILDFSTAVTGVLFFVPSADLLDDPPNPGAGASAPAAEPTSEPAALKSATIDQHGQLNIGSLKGRTS
jgi:putative iron-dependent peroxidase